MNRLAIIPTKYIERYIDIQPISLLKHFNKIKVTGANAGDFNFYAISSAVYSSMIEGNTIDIDSFMRYSHSGMGKTGKPYKQIDDLKKSYEFAKSKKLNSKNVLAAHKILSNNLPIESKYRGSIRDKDVMIYNYGTLIYVGADAKIVKGEFDKLFHDIDLLIERKMTISEVFYFASMIHFVFTHIHPFADGNGRTSRLIEKWFLAEKLGEMAWLIQSEKLYQKRIASYYKNLNVGEKYDSLNYEKCIPFLLMLPMSLNVK